MWLNEYIMHGFDSVVIVGFVCLVLRCIING